MVNIFPQCCGLVVMFVILYFYQSQKKVKLNTEKAYMGIWSICLLSIILDIASVVVIDLKHMLPEIFVHSVCKFYLIVIIAEALFAFRYVCIEIFIKNSITQKWNIQLIILAFILGCIVMALPVQEAEAGQGSFAFGPSVIATYVFGIILLVLICVTVTHYKKQIDERRRKGVIVWAGLFLIAAGIQFIRNDILIVSFASVIGILYIFLIKENPEVNLDRDTGLFNLNALFALMKQKHAMNQNVSILCLVYDSNRNGTMSYETEKEVHYQIVSFIGELPRGTAFRSSSNEFIIVFDNEEYAEGAIATIEKRFEKPWGNDEMRLVAADWYYLESTNEVERSADILPIFQYAKQNRTDFGSHSGVRITDEVVNRMYDERVMETEIVEAMAEDRVEVFYQPIFSVKDKCFSCAEALVRIRDRDGNIIPPGKFIDVAEKRGLIISLGERVFEKVCQLLVEEKPQDFGVEYIEVNLSMIQCAYEHLADDFIKIMSRYKVDPTRILLEITESQSIKEKQILLENMKKLKAEGIKFALDDFGTGQSNLNYIVEMPVDVVKFDSTMTNAYFENGTAKHVMSAAMQMVQDMNLEIVSEGIEEKEQYHTMKELGIDYIQGYYFSKPIETSEFMDFIKENQE